MFQAYIPLLLYDSALQISQIQSVCFYYFPAPATSYFYYPEEYTSRVEHFIKKYIP